MRLRHGWIRAGVLLMASAILVSCTGDAPGAQQAGEWSYYGGSKAFQRYSSLDQITRDNVSSVQVLWRRPAMDAELTAAFPDLQPEGYQRSTPVLIDGVLYSPNALGLVEAFDAATGETVWFQEPFSPEEAGGRSSRGLDSWSDGSDRRIFVVRGEHLYALSAATGEAYPGFGEQGRVSLTPESAQRYHYSSGPIVVGNVVVVAGNNDGAGDGGVIKEATREDVRGFDVRSGRLVWTFHVVPQEGEFGTETWGEESWRYSGDLGSWCCLSADEELGYVYVPLSAPTSSRYGGHRPGDNLFSNSLVALDAATGERVWHFQMVHHDLWEYDNQGPPILGDITVDGRRIKAVMQASKTAFLYAFDRETGEPVWPIEERPVPQSRVPGEHTSPTQPFPSKPPPFDRQGVAEEDLIDFTPELRAQALAIADSLILAPIFTPGVLLSDAPEGKLGVFTIPGGWGAGNWNTGAFDPETGVYYAASHTLPGLTRLGLATGADATMDYGGTRGAGRPRTDIEGLPIVKPPYGRITAIDMNRGEHLWMIANGDGPRDHPLIADLDLPPLGNANRPTPLVTRTLLFIGEGSDAIMGTPEGMWGTTFRALDKATGELIWETDLGAGTTGGPMTYLHNGKQYIVVAVGGRDHFPEFVALGLP